MRYDGFISYSHRSDLELARALERGIERIGRPWHRRRALDVFCDTSDLSASPQLWPSVRDTLDASEWYIVLASPDAAGSPWVDREAGHWLATRSPDRVLVVLTGGGDGPAGVEALRSTVPPSLAELVEGEPLYVDLRWAHGRAALGLDDPDFRDAVARLAAPIRGMRKDELVGEDLRQHRRLQRLTRTVAVTLGVLLVAAVVGAVVAVREARRADRQRAAAEALARDEQARALAAISLLRDGRSPTLRLLTAAEAYRLAPELPETSAAVFEALQGDLRLVRRDAANILPGWEVNEVWFSDDGSSVAGRLLGTGLDPVTAVALADPRAGLATARVIDQPADNAAFTPDGRRFVAVDFQGQRLWWVDVDRLDAPVMSAPLGGYADLRVLAVNDAVAAVVLQDGGAVAVSFGDGSVRPLAPEQPKVWTSAAVGDRLAVLGDGQDRLLVVPLDGGPPEWSPTGVPVTALAMTPDDRQVVVAGQAGDPLDGVIATFRVDGSTLENVGFDTGIWSGTLRRLLVTDDGGMVALAHEFSDGGLVTTLTGPSSSSEGFSGIVYDIDDGAGDGAGAGAGAGDGDGDGDGDAGGRRLVTVGDAGETTVYRIDGPTGHPEIIGQPYDVASTEDGTGRLDGATTTAVFAGDQLVTFGAALVVWDIQEPVLGTDRPLRPDLFPPEQTLQAVPHDGGGELVVRGQIDATERVNRRAPLVTGGVEVEQVVEPDEVPGLLTLSTDGRLALARDGDQVGLVDLTDGTTSRPPGLPSRIDTAIGIGPRRFAVASGTTITVVDLDQPTSAVAEVGEDVAALAVSADRRTLGWASKSGAVGTVSLADLGDVRRFAPLLGAGALVRFDATARRLVAVDEPGMVRVYDVATGTTVVTASSRVGSVLDATFEGTTLVVLRSGYVGGTAEPTAYDLDDSTVLERACAAAGRPLTEQEWRILRPGEPYDPACRA